MAVECTYCEEKINAKRGIYIKCTTCQEIKLCLECFSAGAIIAEHESDHPYELIDCGSFPIVDEQWKAHEELALLEAIELYGIGSWNDIATAVETRTADECCERYTKTYVENFFGRSSWNAIDKNLYKVHDHTCNPNQPLSPCLSLPERHKIVDITREQQIRLGYMPKRDDFEREYDNDAELLVSKLAVNANDDNELDQDLKIAHINMYTDKLRERFRRKRIVLEYNLVKLFFHMHPEENVNLQDTELKLCESLPHQGALKSITNGSGPVDSIKDNSMPITDRVSSKDGEDQKPSKDSHEDFKHSDKTAKEKSTPSIQNTILSYFRRIEPSDEGAKNSIATSTSTATATSTTTTTTNPSIALLEQSTSSSSKAPETSILSSYFSNLNKSIAEQDFNNMEKKLRIFCQFSSVEEHNQLIRNLAREKELKLKIKELIKKRKNGYKFLSQSNGNDSDTSCRKSPSTNKKTPTKDASPDQLEEPMDVDTDEAATLSPTKVNQKKNSIRNESTKAIMNVHLNQNSEPSWRLLSESEKRLCKSSNLKPSQYISFKAFIIKEHNQKKKRKGAAQKLFSSDIDKNVKKRIVDFLTRNNWIKV